jgi:hypothetical protein
VKHPATTQSRGLQSRTFHTTQQDRSQRRHSADRSGHGKVILMTLSLNLFSSLRWHLCHPWKNHSLSRRAVRSVVNGPT